MKKTIRIHAMLWVFLLSALIVLVISFYSNKLMSSSTVLLEENAHGRLSALNSALHAQALKQNLDMQESPVAAPAKYEQLFLTFLAKYDADYVCVLTKSADGFNVLYERERSAETSARPTLDSEACQKVVQAVADTGTQTYYDPMSTTFGASAYDFAFFPIGDAPVDSIIGIAISDSLSVNSLYNMTNLTIAQTLAVLTALASGFFGFLLYRRKAMASEQSNTAKSQFLSRMSHEIRTPMNAIIGLCRIAKDEDDIAEVKKNIAQIDISSGHLLALINDILDLSKIESGKLSLEKIPIDVHKELALMEHAILPKIEEKNQNLTLHFDPKMPPYIVSDSVHIRQVIMNLLSNAVKFTPEHGEIKLSVDLLNQKETLAHIAVSVEDNGIGIDRKNLDSLFEPFEQGDGSNTRKYGGSGLGLSISKRLAEMLGGNLTVTTQVGKGSTFIFDFCADEAAPFEEPAETAAADSSDVTLEGKTVLVVDDSEVNQIVAESALENLGCAIEFADNGQEACDMYAAAPDKYSIIFMDVQMPILDGYEATKKIRAMDYDNAKQIPIVAMTANVYKEDIDQALASGMNSHVAKPVDFEQVRTVVQNIMRP